MFLHADQPKFNSVDHEVAVVGWGDPKSSGDKWSKLLKGVPSAFTFGTTPKKVNSSLVASRRLQDASVVVDPRTVLVAP